MKFVLSLGIVIIVSTAAGLYFGKGIGSTFDYSALFEKYKYERGTVFINFLNFKDSNDSLFVGDPGLDKDGFYICFLEIKDYNKVAGGLGAVVVLRDSKNIKHGVIKLQIDSHDGVGLCEWHLSRDFIVNSEIQYQIFPNTENVALVKGVIGDLGYWKKVDGKVKNFPFSSTE